MLSVDCIPGLIIQWHDEQDFMKSRFHYRESVEWLNTFK